MPPAKGKELRIDSIAEFLHQGGGDMLGDELGCGFRFTPLLRTASSSIWEGKDLNRRKNDFHDAEVAAQLLCSGEFTETKLLQGVYAELRPAYNTYRRLVKERTRITNLVKGLVDGLFPEFTQVSKDPCG